MHPVPHGRPASRRGAGRLRAVRDHGHGHLEGEPLLDVVAFVCVLCEPMTAQVRVLLLANALARASEAMVGNG